MSRPGEALNFLSEMYEDVVEGWTVGISRRGVLGRELRLHGKSGKGVGWRVVNGELDLSNLAAERVALFIGQALGCREIAP